MVCQPGLPSDMVARHKGNGWVFLMFFVDKPAEMLCKTGNWRKKVAADAATCV